MPSYVADIYIIDQLGHADVETSMSYEANDHGAAEKRARSWCSSILPITGTATYSRFSLDGIVVKSWPHRALV